MLSSSAAWSTVSAVPDMGTVASAGKRAVRLDSTTKRCIVRAVPDEYLDSAGVARLLGVSPATIRAYRSRGQAGFPEPDVIVGDTPGWLPATIERWQAQRRGPGNWRRNDGEA